MHDEICARFIKCVHNYILGTQYLNIALICARCPEQKYKDSVLRTEYSPARNFATRNPFVESLNELTSPTNLRPKKSSRDAARLFKDTFAISVQGENIIETKIGTLADLT